MSTRANLSPEHLIRQGWAVFKLQPWLCVGMFVLYSITQPGGGGTNLSGGGSLNDINAMSQAGALLMTAALAGIGVITLMVLVIAGPMRGGYELAMLRMVRGDRSVVFGDLFAGFSKFVKLMLTMLLGALLLAVGIMLCVVPGIILGVGLWPAYLLVMEDDLGPVEALKGAWALTDGYKMELFILGLANTLLLFVGLLACCVGVFVAGPVAPLAWMGAYDEMRRARGAAALPSAPAQGERERHQPLDPTVGTPPPMTLGPGDTTDNDDEEATTKTPPEG